MLSLSWPLLLNGLLVNLFFRADVLVIQAFQGAEALGTYDAAYKYINMLLLIPSYFTLAVFPLLSRHAAAGTDRVSQSFTLAAKLLLIVAWPIVLVTVVLAPELIRVLAGEQFLPGSADALRFLIWFLPWSYVNGVTQYVLIAANRQRTITLAFVLAVVFNLAANLALVPIYGYRAAAVVTVLTEIVLFVPLAASARRYLGSLAWLRFAARPTAAAVVMGVATFVGLRGGPWLGLLVGGAAYLAALLATGAVGATEARIAREVIGRPDPVSAQEP